MKKIIFTLLLAVVPAILFAQSNMSCCPKSSATSTFAMLGGMHSFQLMHEAPLPFTLKDPKGEMIHFDVANGPQGSAYFVKATKPTNNYLLVFHEWWGLNDYIRQMADKLGGDIGNINVLALDLYDGKVAATPDMAGQYMKEASEDRIRNIIQGALNYAGKNAHIFTIGWCFGGGWSLQATLMAGKQADGCVMYYGAPETDVNKLKTLHTDVLGIYGEKDKWLTPAVVKTFEDNMKKAGKKLTIKEYDADHGFANPSSPRHNVEATKDAYKHTLDYFHAHVKS